MSQILAKLRMIFLWTTMIQIILKTITHMEYNENDPERMNWRLETKTKVPKDSIQKHSIFLTIVMLNPHHLARLRNSAKTSQTRNNSASPLNRFSPNRRNKEKAPTLTLFWTKIKKWSQSSEEDERSKRDMNKEFRMRISSSIKKWWTRMKIRDSYLRKIFENCPRRSKGRIWIKLMKGRRFSDLRMLIYLDSWSR